MKGKELLKAYSGVLLSLKTIWRDRLTLKVGEIKFQLSFPPSLLRDENILLRVDEFEDQMNIFFYIQNVVEMLLSLEKVNFKCNDLCGGKVNSF